MSGLKKRTSANYLRLKNGKFYLSTDKEFKQPYDELEGVIKAFYFKTDEWEGQEIEKLNIVVNDAESDYVISFSFDSSYTSTLIGFLVNADLSKSLSLVPVEKTEDGDKKKRTILVKQGGKWLKQAYTRDSGLVPAMKQVTVNKKKIWDKTEFLEFFRDVVNNNLIPRVEGNNANDTEKAETESVAYTTEDETSDDLPF